MNKSVLMVFVKNPILGKAKTRLAATIGEEKALEVYKLLLNKTAEVTEGLVYDKVVFYTDFINPNDMWHSGAYSKKLQEGNDLGERISAAFQWAFHCGYEHTCIIGSDCYDLDLQILNEAFEVLETKDVVVGPSLDGGYYLLGMSEYNPRLFKDITWSTDEVFAQTLAASKKLSLTTGQLKKLSDIDVEEDILANPALKAYANSSQV